jgi:hypothetical protein
MTCRYPTHADAFGAPFVYSELGTVGVEGKQLVQFALVP